MRPGRDWQALVRAPRLHGVSGAGPASRFFVERVTAYAARDPAGSSASRSGSSGCSLGGDRDPPEPGALPGARLVPVLWVLLWKVPGLAFPFGLLLPLAVVGLGVAWRRAPVLAASVVLLGLTVAAFFVTARYRAPLVPLLALFAAAGRPVGGRRGEPAGAGGGRRRRPSASTSSPTLARGRCPPDERRRRAGPGPLARARGPAPGGPRALRAARAGGARARSTHGTASPSWRPRSGIAAEAERRWRGSAELEPEFLDTALLLARAALDAGCGPEAEGFARRAVALDARSDLARRAPRRRPGAPGRPAGRSPGGLSRPGLRRARSRSRPRRPPVRA